MENSFTCFDSLNFSFLYLRPDDRKNCEAGFWFLTLNFPKETELDGSNLAVSTYRAHGGYQVI